MKEFWNKAKKFLNPFLLVMVAFTLGVIYGLTGWEPIGWLLMIVLVPMIIGGIIMIIFAWIVSPIKWLINIIKKK